MRFHTPELTEIERLAKLSLCSRTKRPEQRAHLLIHVRCIGQCLGNFVTEQLPILSRQAGQSPASAPGGRRAALRIFERNDFCPVAGWWFLNRRRAGCCFLIRPLDNTTTMAIIPSMITSQKAIPKGMIRISQPPPNAPNMGSSVEFIPTDTEAKPEGRYS
jgi:hypothetical protein